VFHLDLCYWHDDLNGLRCFLKFICKTISFKFLFYHLSAIDELLYNTVGMVMTYCKFSFSDFRIMVIEFSRSFMYPHST
jgi:hypothetical protein